MRLLGLYVDYIYKECDKEFIKVGKIIYVYIFFEVVLLDDMWRSMFIEFLSFKLFVVDEVYMVINWYV